MDISFSLVPHLQALGSIGYWIVFVFAWAESVVIVGALVPSGIILAIAGFLAAEGSMDAGDLVWVAALGIALGDTVSYS